MLHLDRNEAPFDLEPEIKQKLADQLLEQSWNRYPPKYADQLSDLIAEKFDVAANQVLLGNGSSEIIQNLIAIFRQGKSRLVYPMPSYELFEICGNMMDMQHVPWHCTEDMQYDYANYPGEDGSIYVICNPNNPSGDLIQPEFIEKRLQQEPNSLFILDEAYIEFSAQSKSLRPLVESYPNAVLVRTLSKAMGLAGVRFGYAIIHPDLADYLAAFKLPYRINHFSAVVANFALSHEDTHIGWRAQAINDAREHLFNSLDSLLAGTTGRVFPSVGNFLLIDAPEPDFIAAMAARGVALGRVKHYPHLARVTVGTESENHQFLSILQSYLQAKAA